MFDPSDLLKHDDFIVVTVTTDNVKSQVGEIIKGVDTGLRRLFRNIGDSTAKHMRRNVSAPQPYGGTETTIVRRQGRVYDTIGYRITKDDPGPYMQVGAIKGTAFGRQLARVHDQGKTIYPKNGWWHAGEYHRYLIYPPFGSPARDPATGEQIMNASQTAEKFYSQWDLKDKILVRRTQGSPVEVAFFKRSSVRIPARGIISREVVHVQRELERKLATYIDASLRLETIRI